MSIDFYAELPRITEVLMRHYPRIAQEWATREQMQKALNGYYKDAQDFAEDVIRTRYMGEGLSPGIAAFLHACVCLDLNDLT